MTSAHPIKLGKIKQAEGIICYLCGSIKTFLEHNAHTPEWGHDLPAGPQLTGPRHTVTFTLNLHVMKDGLRRR